MKRSTRFWSRRNVPEQLWPEILVRLPVKTLLQLRSVSKQWRSMIDDPDFARLHLRLSVETRSQIHFFLSKNKLQVRCIPSLKAAPSIHVPKAKAISDLYGWYPVFSLDGLFVLSRITRDAVTQLMLWNPATRKTLILPHSPEITDRGLDLGLGFDPSSKDYKYVSLIHTDYVGDLESVAVFSLSTKSWKMNRSHQDLPRVRRFLGRVGLCLQGFLFQLSSNNVNGVNLVSFNLRSESLSSVTLPDNEDNAVNDPSWPSPCLTMADDGCSLAVVFCNRGSGSLWVLEGLGADDVKSCTWSKRYTFSATIPDSLPTTGGFFFYLMKNGEMLIRWPDMVTSYNLKTNKEKVIEKKQLGAFAFPYAESLLGIPNKIRKQHRGSSAIC